MQELIIPKTTVSADGTFTAGSTFLTPTQKAAKTYLESLQPAATQSDMEAATGSTQFVSPGSLVYHPGWVKGWVYVTVSGGTPTVAADNGVTSIVDDGTGLITLSPSYFSISSANYAPMMGTELPNTSYALTDDRKVNVSSGTQQTGGTIQLTCLDSTNATNVLKDPPSWHAAWLGDV